MTKEDTKTAASNFHDYSASRLPLASVSDGAGSAGTSALLAPASDIGSSGMSVVESIANSVDCESAREPTASPTNLHLISASCRRPLGACVAQRWVMPACGARHAATRARSRRASS